MSQSGYSVSSPTFDITAIRFIKVNTGFAGQNNGTVIKTTNGGLNWFDPLHSPNGDINSIGFVNMNTGFLATSTGEIWKSTNHGVNWNLNFTNNSGLTGLYADSILGCYIVGSNGNILKTTNAGINWIKDSIGTYNLHCIKFTDSNSGWLCGSNGAAYKTTNRGINWISTSSFTSDEFLSMSFINANTGWMTSYTSRWIKTTDFGNSWVTGVFSGYYNLSIYFLNQDTGFYSRSFANWGNAVRQIYRTTDGMSWNQVYADYHTIGETNNFLSIYFKDNNIGFVTSKTGDMVCTISGGDSWFPIHFFNNPLLNVYFKGDDYGWIVGANGLILATQQVFVGIEKNSFGNVLSNYSLSQNYPNPFNPATKIKYEIEKNSFVNIKVYDILGKEIENLVNEKQNAGTYKVSFDGSNLPSGIYFYRIQVGNLDNSKQIYSETKKMILLK